MATSESKKKSKSKSKSSKDVKDEVPETAAAAVADPSSDNEASPQKSPDSKKRKSANVDEIEVDLEAPEPPSKRAKRALKKGKKLPPKLDSDDEREAKKKKEKEDKEQASKRSEHGVWIGNLPFFVTADELRKWLVANSGEMITEASITRLHMPTTKVPGKDKPNNKGFAYVDFDDVAPKVAAIALTEAELGHRKLLIKDATSYEGRPKKEAEAEGEKGGKAAEAKEEVPKSSKIFVGNLSFKTTDDDVQQHFEKCGQIDWVKVATFEDSGKCKGYGWVKFREPESAGWAVKGFVKIKEEIETEDDFVDKKKDEEGDEEMKDGEDEGSEDEDDDDKKKKKEKKKQVEEQKVKTRKWWVNKLLGRPLKIELAEDDQTRYKKRFGKDAPKRNQQEGEESGAAEGAARKERKPRADAKPASELKAQDDLMVARLTGAAAKHTGTKITFD
ncbi:RNA recognition domain-containing protein [Colletotrichum karsti]|uniref:RNA recognition domain-containing protein n=1 Tax=Colletotrichum karsti TaxID=1095194 RepID=A0A9P6LLW3_9PEZI|nr:RNA recognition domain-containing protein [Colletotrichum karsti]KAF9880874.1 RNA recognition domain-containing protein [Colletotrichum karsti]